MFPDDFEYIATFPSFGKALAFTRRSHEQCTIVPSGTEFDVWERLDDDLNEVAW